VESTTLSTVAYDADRQLLQLEFRNRTAYLYLESLDEGGWEVRKPFLVKTHIPYRMLLGDDATAQRYGIRNMPDTFLIDRQGRVAAAYLAGLWTKTT